MPVISPEDLAQLIALGYEQRGVEFKGPGPLTDRLLLARVARAVLGMSNRRDGGIVVIGVNEEPNGLNPVGLTDADAGTWTYDDVASALAPYADPNVSLRLDKVTTMSRLIVVLRVEEFEDVPVLCARSYNLGKDVVLRAGACYIRSRHKPETSEIPTQADMRDLLDLAMEKGLRRFLSTLEAAGLRIPSVERVRSDAEAFADQMRDFDGE